MKKLLFLASAFVATISSVNSQTAAAARAAGVGANVSVRGVCINGAELGVIRYIQDVTGGIAAYGGNLSGLLRGDSVVITGPITEYKNLYEITPATFVYISAGHLPNPEVIMASQFGEAHESELVKVMNCQFGTTGTFGANMNYTVTSNGQPLVVRTNTASPIVGMAIPSGSVNIVGVGSQFCNAPVSGCTDGYQLLIRDMSDITAYVAPAPTGISEFSKNSAVSVFPNPATSTLSFKLDNNEQVASVKVSDIYGRIVFATEENTTTINVSHLASGLYSISISTGKNNYQSKFIVE